MFFLWGGATDNDPTPADVAGVVSWYNPNVLGSLFQDSGGTTPVTSDGDPVGLMQDLSGEGNHLIQATSGNRPVYRTDGWTRWLEFNGTSHTMATASAVAMTPDCYIAGVFEFVGAAAGGAAVETLFGFGEAGDTNRQAIISRRPAALVAQFSNRFAATPADPQIVIALASDTPTLFEGFYESGVASLIIGEGTPATETRAVTGTASEEINLIKPETPTNFHGGVIIGQAASADDKELIRDTLKAAAGL